MHSTRRHRKQVKLIFTFNIPNFLPFPPRDDWTMVCDCDLQRFPQRKTLLSTFHYQSKPTSTTLCVQGSGRMHLLAKSTYKPLLKLERYLTPNMFDESDSKKRNATSPNLCHSNQPYPHTPHDAKFTRSKRWSAILSSASDKARHVRHISIAKWC